MQAKTGKSHAFLVSVPLVSGYFALVGWSVAATYYISDDFVFFYESLRPGSGLGVWVAPFNGHFAPGIFALTRVVSGIWGLERVGAVVFSLLLAAVILGLLYGIARLILTRVTSSKSTALSAAALSAVTVGLAVPHLFYALGVSLLPLTATTLAGVLFALKGLHGGRPGWWVLSGIVVAFGFLFWELAALNVFLVPAFAMVLFRFIGDERGEWRRSLRAWLLTSGSYLLPISAAAVGYLYNYTRFDFGSGVEPASLMEVLGSLPHWLGIGTTALIGGGPVPESGQELGLGSSNLLRSTNLAPWLIGISIIIYGLSRSRIRPLIVLVLLTSLFQGSAILYARYNFLGPDFVLLNPRYYSGISAYVQLLLLAIWVDLIRTWSSRRVVGRSCGAVTLVASTVVSIVSWIFFSQQIGGDSRRELIQAMAQSMAQAPSDATVLATELADQLGWLSPPWNNTRTVMWPAFGESRWGVGNGEKLLVLGPSGHLKDARVQPLSTWVEPATSSCTTTATLPFVEFDEPVSQLITLQVTVESEVTQEVSVALNDTWRDVRIPAGSSPLTIQTYWYGTMVVKVQGIAPICIAEARVSTVAAG